MFGVLTTVVNYILYFLLRRVLPFNTVIIANGIAWVGAVLFAYFTNRKWVFESKAQNKGEIVKEIAQFFSARLLSGLLDMALMWIFVDMLTFNEVIIKTVSSIIVIVFNYIASKFIIFRDKKGSDS